MDVAAMQFTGRLFVQSTIALIVVGFLALFGIVGMTIWLGERAQVYFDEVIEARDARSAAVDLRDAVQSMESSQRGFLLTGNQIYLAPYGTAKAVAARKLDDVRRILAPFPDAKAPVERLADVVTEKIGEMDETIALKRARNDAQALALVRTNRGKALMDEANVFFSGVIRAADERLTAGVTEQKTNATWLRWVSIVGGVVIVAVVGAASLTIIRYTRELQAARDEVAVLNEGLEVRVKSRTADLALANDEIQRFAYIVTHDLRAPLVNIMGFTSELESSVKTLQATMNDPGLGSSDLAAQAHVAIAEDMPEAIGFIRSSTKKMDSLINAILKLSREGKRALRPEEVDLREVLSASVASVQHQLGEADGAIDVSADLPLIASDRLSLEQIFGNLLDNAVKYRSKDRPLRIAVGVDSAPVGLVAVVVSDNGRGIADQDRERVFELFRRSGLQDQPGEGIGLAYVRAVVRNLGGDITVSSVLDKGTTFRIVLPRTLHVVESSAA